MKRSRIGVWQAIVCATIALSPCAFYASAMFLSGSFKKEVIDGVFKLTTAYGFEILCSLIALYSSAIILGSRAGRRIERNYPNNKLLCLIIGIGLAMSCLLTSLLAGAAVGLLHEAVAGRLILATSIYLFLPAEFMLLGSLPAAVLGVLYTILVFVTIRRRRLSNI